MRLEKYHYRINYAKGILESRNVTYDRSMRKLAKPLPLDTPTTIELTPGNSIRVTLIDANHCIGAVMFLIEGDGKAVLYTGDIRAETWWINSMVQNPVLIPYTLGKRRLDCMYLDTTFATKSQPYKEFPSKAEGIRELLHKISEYPHNTIFYFHSWTFGYENVWVALSNALESRIHLDDYRTRIYGSLSTLDKKLLRESGLNVQSDNKYLRESGLKIHEAPALCGFRNGNHIQPGCLTSRESARIHSCERDMGCQVMDNDKEAKVVHIIPIITRANGTEIAELGAGGGKGDLDQKEELETGSLAEIGKLMELCAETIKDENLLSKVLAVLHHTLAGNGVNIDLDRQMQKASEASQDGISLQTLVSVLSANVSKSAKIEEPRNRTIRFPYSRHSSYSELCELVAAFRPKDVFPCTVDEERWSPELSIQSLFGDLCSEKRFRHDAEMTELYTARMQRHLREKRDREQSQNETQSTDEQLLNSQILVKRVRESEENSVSDHVEFTTPIGSFDGTCGKPSEVEGVSALHNPTLVTPQSCGHEDQPFLHGSSPPVPPPVINSPPAPVEPALPPFVQDLSTLHIPTTSAPTRTTTSVSPSQSTASGAKNRRKKLTNRQIAYDAAIGSHLNWADYGGLTSTRKQEDREEQEL
jgi:hypothetical protein